MRLDKYLKVSRIIKRRTIAKEAVEKGYVLINKKPAKAASLVKIGDILSVTYRGIESDYRIEQILEYATEEKAKTMYSKLDKEND